MGSILCPHVVKKGSVASLSPSTDAELEQPVSGELKQSAAYCRTSMRVGNGSLQALGWEATAVAGHQIF